VLTVKVPIKYCEDCRWFTPGRNGAEFSKCRHPACDLDGLNYIGRKVDGSRYCTHARNGVRPICGPEGKYFEEREVVRVPLPKRWWHRLIESL
jgi:hypothetical protein